jgi:hypothetical protein
MASLAGKGSRSFGLVEGTRRAGILLEVLGQMLGWELEAAPMLGSVYVQHPTAEGAVFACLGCA